MAHALFVLVALATCHISAHCAAPPASPNPSPGTKVTVVRPNAAKEFLDTHNQARAAVGVEPFKWNETLANATIRLLRYQRNKMGCKLANPNLISDNYGGNQYWSGGLSATPRMAVESWVEEKNYYNHANNSCAPNHMCALYTQVVWRKSLELGCAQDFCVKEKATLIICFYYPPGNYKGESPY